MNRTELIDELAERFEGNRRAAGHALDAVLDTITRTVAKGEKVALTGFGVFERVQRAARTARNPATGELIKVRAMAVPRFRPSQALKDIVSGARRLPRLVIKPPPVRPTKVAPAKKAAAAPKRAPARKVAAKRAPARKVAAKRAPARKVAAKKAAAKKAAAKKAAAKKTTKRAAKKTTSRR